MTAPAPYTNHKKTALLSFGAGLLAASQGFGDKAVAQSLPAPADLNAVLLCSSSNVSTWCDPSLQGSYYVIEIEKVPFSQLPTSNAPIVSMPWWGSTEKALDASKAAGDFAAGRTSQLPHFAAVYATNGSSINYDVAATFYNGLGFATRNNNINRSYMGALYVPNTGESVNYSQVYRPISAIPASKVYAPVLTPDTILVADEATFDAPQLFLSGTGDRTIDFTSLSNTISSQIVDVSSSNNRLLKFVSTDPSKTITLTGLNTYDSGTQILGGTLALENAGSIANSRAIAVLNTGQSAATLDISRISGSGTSIRALFGNGTVQLGTKDLRISGTQASTTGLFPGGSFSGTITGSGGLVVDLANGGGISLSGTNDYTGETNIKSGLLDISGSISSSTTTVYPGATLSGTGVINGFILNEGIVAPGGNRRVGTLTVNGDYAQLSPGTLQIEVNGSEADLLKLTGSNRTILLGGELNISSLPGTQITAGKSYTAISTPLGTQGGDIGFKTTFGVVGASGYTFVRETDPQFSQLDNGTAQACDPKQPELCTDLRFGWLQNTTTTTDKKQKPSTIPTTLDPGQPAIQAVKPSGGAITTAASGNPTTNTNTCIANGGSSTQCNSINQPGSGVGASNPNTVVIAKQIDAGNASVQAAVNQGIQGGAPIPTASGTASGYTTNQAKAALVSPDFVNVVGALFAIPTRQGLNAALHSMSAEPYASMQSVALEALEQFRANTLALTNSQRLPFIVEEQACETSAEPGNSATAQPNDTTHNCKPVTRQKLTPWSLLIDGSNTQASLNGTNDLASLDYNIFSSSYGLQYDFNKTWSAGAAFGYGRANLYNYEYSNTSINSDTYSGAAWALYRPSEAWRFTALAGYMNLQYSSDRSINLGGLNRNATANWSGNGFTTALAAEYDWILSGNKDSRSAVRIKPSTYFSYALHNQGSFSESGAESLNLQVDSHTADSLIYGIGFTLETPIVTGKSSRLIPRLYVGYEYDFNGNSNEEHQLTASFAEQPALGSMDVLGQNRGANAVDVALSLEYETSETLSIYGNVGSAFWSNGNEINYGAGLKLRW